MSSRPDLLVAPCSYRAAKHAIENWHYSKSVPVNPCSFGVWEGGRFVGAVSFGLSAQQNLGRFLGLSMFECSELVRVALRDHAHPVTKIVAVALRLYKQHCPGIRAVVSYADCDMGHVGGIYKGGGWTYLGLTQQDGGTPKFRVRGVVMHGRSVYSRWGKGAQQLGWLREHIDPSAEKVYTAGKHKYCWAYDDGIKAQLVPLTKPYPKRASEPTSVGTGVQPGEGGATPTRTLQDD